MQVDSSSARRVGRLTRKIPDRISFGGVLAIAHCDG